MARLIKYYSIVVLMAFLSGCANMQAPGGGEVDRIPPQIVSVSPENGQRMFNYKEIEFTFSEYVDKRTFKDAIFVSPSLEKGFDVKWSGKTAILKFNEELKPDITYNITIGTSVTDLNNNNNMAVAYSYIFSTGDVIDKATVSGKIYDKEPNKIFVFAYLLGTPGDSILKRKPDFVTQVGSTGEFRLSGLPKGEFRFFAVGNAFGDLIYNLNSDRIGIYSKDVTLSQNDTLREKLNFFMTKFDTIPPVLQKAVMTDINHVLLSFNEDIAISSIESANISFIDSVSNGLIKPLFVYCPGGKKSEAVVSVTGNIKKESALAVEITGVKDIFGNTASKMRMEVPISEKRDTIPVSISQIEPVDLNNIMPVFPEFTVKLDDGVDPSKVISAITVSDTSKKLVKTKISRVDDAIYKVTVEQKLEPLTEYFLKINTAELTDAAGNMRDTLFQSKFTTYNSINFTGLSGTIKGVTGKYLVELSDVEKGDRVYKTVLQADGKFEFVDLLPGKYNLKLFEDKRGDKEYFFGSLFPFEHSAKFFVHRFVIELIPRWVTFDFKWNVD